MLNQLTQSHDLAVAVRHLNSNCALAGDGSVNPHAGYFQRKRQIVCEAAAYLLLKKEFVHVRGVGG